MQFAWSYAPTLALETAVHLGVFDYLDKEPRSLDELTSLTKVSKRGLAAILDVLAGFNFLEREDGRFSLTPESSAFLVAGKPGYHGMFFKHISDQLLPKWLQLRDVVKTGKPAMAVNDKSEGPGFFAAFVESLFPLSFRAATMLGEHLHISASRSPISVLDVGAGSGVWGIALALQSKNVRIHAVDWPLVLEVTRRVAAKHGVADRLITAPGDFSEADFGSGHQVATVGHILHSEGEVRSRQLLKKIFSALAPGGTIAIQEFIVNDDRKGPAGSLIFALNMIVNTQEGNAFTFAEMSAWLRETGFENPRLLDVPAVSPLILATKPA
jgi:SAM-dependent methyltransferase